MAKKSKECAPKVEIDYTSCKYTGHNVQNHSTPYGPVYWCNKCWKTPAEIKEEDLNDEY